MVSIDVDLAYPGADRPAAFLRRPAVHQQGQAGDGAALDADGSFIIETQFDIFPARVTLGEVVGGKRHAAS